MGTPRRRLTSRCQQRRSRPSTAPQRGGDERAETENEELAASKRRHPTGLVPSDLFNTDDDKPRWWIDDITPRTKYL